MAFGVDRIIINNRAPFQNIDLSFGPKGVTVLTALNGKGKTTILSYIVDAWVELTRRVYSQSYEGKENSYYRVSTPLYDIDQGKPSIVYIRFKNDGVNCDYADIRNKGDQSWYESIIPMQDRIPYPQFATRTSNKCISTNCENKDLITSIFDNSVNTFFPSYRFELPNYLNENMCVH